MSYGSSASGNINKGWPDIHDQRYIHQCQSGANNKNPEAVAEASRITKSFHGTSLGWLHKTSPSARKQSKSCAMKRSTSLWVWRKVDGNWDNSMIRIYDGREANAKQILEFKDTNKLKKWDCENHSVGSEQ